MAISMRAARSTVTALALALAVNACGDDDDNGGGTDPDPTGTVSGEVTLEGGVGVAGADLALARTGATTRNRTSEADGSFSFTSVPIGTWTLTISPPVDLELAAGQSASVGVTVSDGQTSTVDFLLAEPDEPPQPDATILATVEADGTPRAGTTLRLFAVAGTDVLDTEVTAAGGTATFDVVGGDYDVEVVVPTGFQLVAGEEDRKTVTAPSGGQGTVEFALESEPQGTVEVVQATSARTFSPAALTIDVGTTVRWDNDSGMFHTVTPDGHSEWSEAALPDGDSFSHTFDTAGTFEYYCSPHLADGMTGVITVQ